MTEHPWIQKRSSKSEGCFCMCVRKAPVLQKQNNIAGVASLPLNDCCANCLPQSPQFTLDSMFRLCYRVNLHIRVGAPKRFQGDEDIVLEHGAGKICLSVLCTVEAVKHLNVLIANEQIFGQCALNCIEERLTAVVVDLSSSGAVRRINLHRDFQISLYIHS